MLDLEAQGPTWSLELEVRPLHPLVSVCQPPEELVGHIWAT